LSSLGQWSSRELRVGDDFLWEHSHHFAQYNVKAAHTTTNIQKVRVPRCGVTGGVSVPMWRAIA
jgi:hypothetical protein